MLTDSVWAKWPQKTTATEAEKSPKSIGSEINKREQRHRADRYSGANWLAWEEPEGQITTTRFLTPPCLCGEPTEEFRMNNEWKEPEIQDDRPALRTNKHCFISEEVSQEEQAWKHWLASGLVSASRDLETAWEEALTESAHRSMIVWSRLACAESLFKRKYSGCTSLSSKARMSSRCVWVVRVGFRGRVKPPFNHRLPR